MMRLLLVSMAALLLAGCAGASGGAPVTGGGAPASDELKPQRGGVLQQMPLRDLNHLHPWANTSSNSNIFLGRGSIYQQLVEYDYQPFRDFREEFKIVPGLAERWEQLDPTTYLFHLRKGVRWHDGRPLTASDVKFSYDFVGDPANKMTGIARLSTLGTTTVLDDHTVRITTKSIDVEFLKKLTEGLVAILPKHVHDRGDNFERVAIGSGPFKLESFDRQQGVTYVANKDYWKPGQPYLEKWRMLPATDDAGRMASFVARQNDVVKVGNRLQAETILGQIPEAKQAPFYRDNASELFFKMDRPPFNDLRMRQAVHLGIDRREMVSTLTFGDGLFNSPGINPINKAWSIPQSELETLPGWRVAKEQDLAQARRLLTEAGAASGMTFAISVDRSQDTLAQAEMIGAQLRKLGITVKLQPLESGVFTRSVLDGEYEAFISPSASTEPESRGIWRENLHSAGADNRMPIRDPELDRLIEGQATEMDPAKRKQMVLDIQRLLLRQAYVVPLITHSAYFLWQPYVHGWVDNQAAMAGSLDWGQVWVEPDRVPKGR